MSVWDECWGLESISAMLVVCKCSWEMEFVAGFDVDVKEDE